MSRYYDYPDLNKPISPYYNTTLTSNYLTTSPNSYLRKTIDTNTAQINILNKIKNNSEIQTSNSNYRPSADISAYLYQSRKKTRSTLQIPIQAQTGKQYLPQTPGKSTKVILEPTPWNSAQDKYNVTDAKREYYLKVPATIPRQKSNSREYKPYETEDQNDKKDKKQSKVLRMESYKLSIPINNYQQKSKNMNPSPRFMQEPLSARLPIRNRREQQSVKLTSFKRQKTPIKDSPPRRSLEQSNPKLSQKTSAKLSDFSMRKRLGQGKFGEVFQAIHKETNSLFALKRVKKETIKSYMMENQFMMEIKMQLFFNHNNILKLYAVFDDLQYIYLVLEYMEEGTLYDKLKKLGSLPEDIASHISTDVLQGVSYLHENSVAHRDIKPQNIVITCGVCKLCDFGWSAICQDDDRRSTFCGTLDYSAPEILQGKQYGKAIDLWCLGVLTYELLVGKAPFYHISRKQTMRKIMNAQNEEFVLPNTLSVIARGFIGSLIKWDPEQRMQASQALKHAFIRDYSANDL